LQYGCTWINSHFMLVSEMPHGGLKRSGYGKDLSSDSLQDYSVVRHIMARHGRQFSASLTAFFLMKLAATLTTISSTHH
jgi:arylamine N-acetyltransferase